MTDHDKPGGKASKVVGAPAKRSDVGYRRPPREHQFKKGEKPPPRKKKEARRELPMSVILRMVLNEKRRVVIADKVRWVTTADLVIMRAWQEAEKGSPTLRREMFRLSLSSEAPAAEEAPLVVTDRSAPATATGLRLTPTDG